MYPGRRPRIGALEQPEHATTSPLALSDLANEKYVQNIVSVTKPHFPSSFGRRATLQRLQILEPGNCEVRVEVCIAKI